tara:strand:+ start:1322 stop:1507 length:186 start_codon:yes stop_codon:yes gene_type:complete
MENENYEKNPADYALQLVEEGLVSADTLLLCAIKAMDGDQIRWMLDVNELSPRFMEVSDDE